MAAEQGEAPRRPRCIRSWMRSTWTTEKVQRKMEAEKILLEYQECQLLECQEAVNN